MNISIPDRVSGDIASAQASAAPFTVPAAPSSHHSRPASPTAPASRKGSASHSRTKLRSIPTRDPSTSSLWDSDADPPKVQENEVRPAAFETTSQHQHTLPHQTRTASLTSIISSTNESGPSANPSSTEGGTSSQPKTPRQPTTPSSRRRIPNIDTKVASRVSFDETYTSSRSPNNTPAFDSGISRRRLSNSSNQHTPRRSSHPSSDTSSPRKATHRAWISGGLIVPVPAKINKSDDEREDVSDDGFKQQHRVCKRKKWTDMTGGIHEQDSPIINMTPPSATHERSPASIPYSFIPSPLLSTLQLSPLPQDPHNILPLSVPSSPMPSPPASRLNTPLHATHATLPDLQADFAFSSASAGPSGTSGSPRTSTSTSSSRVGYSNYPLRPDSRSSAEEDDRLMFTQHHQPRQSWWWMSQSEDAPVSPKVTSPSPARGVRSKLVPAGTRNWGWLLERVLDVCGVSMDEQRGGKSRRHRNKEKDKLVNSFTKKRSETILGSKFLAQAMAYAPSTPTSIVSR